MLKDGTKCWQRGGKDSEREGYRWGDERIGKDLIPLTESQTFTVFIVCFHIVDQYVELNTVLGPSKMFEVF